MGNKSTLVKAIFSLSILLISVSIDNSISNYSKNNSPIEPLLFLIDKECAYILYLK